MPIIMPRGIVRTARAARRFNDPSRCGLGTNKNPSVRLSPLLSANLASVASRGRVILAGAADGC